jgi:hypothetical protein
LAQYSGGGRPRAWFKPQCCANEATRRFAEHIWTLKCTAPDLRIELHFRAANERQCSSQQGKRHHAECPDICGESRISIASDNLGRHVRWRSTESSELCISGSNLCCEAKINDLHALGASVQKKVFELQVAVDNKAIVTEADAFHHLLVVVPGNRFLETMTRLPLRESSERLPINKLADKLGEE